MCIGATPHHDHDHGPVSVPAHAAGAAVSEPSAVLSRRRLLVGATAASTALLTGASVSPAAATPHRGRRIVDLTHRLVRTFPTFFGPQAVFDDVLVTIPSDGFYGKRWTLDEHVGTHLDAPGHFALGQALVDELDPATLMAPLVVVDVRAKAAEDPNATVTPSDLVRWERRHGRIPERALVVMNSGWSGKVDDGDQFRGGAGFPDLNFPGFSADATDWLLARRDPVGIGVDTLSLDPGDSTTFAVHSSFLGAGRYGIENLTNLDAVPPRGASVFVGPIPWEEGSGSPCRVLATVSGRSA